MTGKALRITDAAVRKLTLPPGKADYAFSDVDFPGFKVRLREGGAKTYEFVYKNAARQNRRIKLGSVGETDANDARQDAQRLAARVRLGEDPAAERAQGRVTAKQSFGALLPRYLERRRSDMRPRSFEEVGRHLTLHAKPLHGYPIDAVTRRQYAALLGDIEERSGPVARNRVRSSLVRFGDWCLSEGYVEVNEASFTNKLAEKSRDRTPADAELAAIGRAARQLGGQYGAIILLLMLLGLRRDEIAALRWSEVDLDRGVITLPPTRTKAKREHVVPLPRQAIVVLKAQPRRTEPDGTPRDLVFGNAPGRPFQDWSGSKQDLDRLLGPDFPHWTPHDFRRALSTALYERFAVPPHVVESVLGHVQPGIAAVYNRSSYIDERARALSRWADHLDALIEGEPSKAARVVKLH